MDKQLKAAIQYYDKFSNVYDWFSPKWYYHEARAYAIEQLALKSGVPCGTGQNFEYFQKYLNGTGLIIGIDLSEGMLEKAKRKKANNNWNNIKIIKEDATQINKKWDMLDLLEPNGRLVIMDWYIPKPTLRGAFIKWIGKGEVNRPIYQYLKSKVANFGVNTSFNRGGVFVATGIKKIV